MNLVRGVAGLLRRSSVTQEGDVPQRQNRGSSSTAPATSWPEIEFSDDGDEKVLHALWEGYKVSSSKAEREKSLEVFLAYFSRVYQSWAPVDSDDEEVQRGPVSGQRSSESGRIVGCRQGHPTRITVDLTQELHSLTKALTELPLASDVNEACVKPHVLEGGSRLLHVLEILTRSSHNRHIFRVSGGLHSLMGLMKAAVVQYKYVASALTPKVIPTSPVGIMSSFFQNLFQDIIRIVSHFINVDAVHIVEHGITQSNTSGPTGVGNISEQSVGSRRVSLDRLGSDSNSVPLMETGGLNWFVELLRIVRKLRKSSVLQDSILEQLILKTLKAALLTNPRAQNHFRSIGGIDAVLDGLGGPSKVETVIQPEEWYACGEFEMQVLSLQVLREAVYRNFNSLQYLRDKGSAETFAEIIFYAAFVSPSRDLQVEQTFVVDYDDNLQGWNSGVAQLCRVLCSFVAPTGDIHSFGGSFAGNYDGIGSTGSYWELAMRWITKVLLGIFQTHGSVSFFSESSPACRLHSTTLQHYMLFVFKKMLASSPAALSIFREEGLWEVMFSEHFFYFEMRFGKSSTQHIVQNQEDFDSEPLRIEVISFVELVATSSNSHNNVPECQVLIEALEQCARIPTVATMIVKSLHRILQLSTDQTVHSFEKLNAMTLLSQVMDAQLQEFTKMLKTSENQSSEVDLIDGSNSSHLLSTRETWKQSREAVFDLFAEYLLASEEARIVSLHNTKTLQVLFDLLWEGESRKFALRHILELMKLPPISENDQEAKLELCIKYLETLSQSGINGQPKDMNVVMDLLNGIQEILQIDVEYYQRLFREGECFVHIVSLLNENLSVEDGMLLSLSVLETLRHLLAGNQVSKSSFRGLVGEGYNTLQTLLVNIHQKSPKEDLLNALLDMLVDGCFDISANMIIQNEEVITLFFNILRQCSDEALQLFELSCFHRILEDSTANKTACVRAGLLSLLLDWFGKELRENLVSKLAMLIETLGRHSISGKDMRMIFSLLGSANQALRFKHQKVLLGVLQGVLREEGPTVFFEFSGKDSGIMVTSSIRWSSMKGFTFSCWMRVDTFEDADNIERLMSLFSFFTDSGKGYVAAIGKEKLVVECISQKRQLLVVKLHLQPKRWYLICIAHSSGRALSGGGTLKVYLDGCLTSTETLRYPKFQEPLTRNTLGGNLPLPTSGSAPFEGLSGIYHSSFRGQFGPVYVFDDSLSYDQIKAIYSAGPGYMYSFLPTEVGFLPEDLSTNHMLDSKDGVASKLVFGFNAQASSGSTLFDVASNVEAASEKVTHEAETMPGTQLCYRCLGRDNIDCVGGVGALFPLLAQLDQSHGIKDPLIDKDFCSTAGSFSSSSDYTAAEVIDLVTSLLDNNFEHQEYMHENKGMAIIGFLLQSVPLGHLKTETISAVMHLLRVVSRTSGAALSKCLVKDALLNVLLNFSIWIHTPFSVQRCLLEELLRYGNEETALVQSVIGLPVILDLVQLFYWDHPKHRKIFGTKGQYYRVINEVIGERPSGEEVKKLRILLLSFAELIMRNGISISDVKVLVAYMERSEDPLCLEDVLNCLLRQLGRKEFSATFVEHIQALGGCQLFLGLLKRKEERLRLLGLQIISSLIMLIPYEKKGSWLITIASGATRAAFEQQRAERGKLDPLVKAIQSRLLPFKFTDSLSATLFDVLLGGASPKQVLQRGPGTGTQQAGSNLMKQVVSRGSQFALPQLLGILLKFLLVCEDSQRRLGVLRDLLRLLEADPASSNAVVLEPTWQIWFLDLWSHIHDKKQQESEESEMLEAEVLEIRSIFAIIHCYCIFNLRGGWRHLERTVSFIHRYANQNMLPRFEILRCVLEDLLDALVQVYPAENGHMSQPCRDNTLYLMTLVDELLLHNVVHFLPFSNEDILEDNNQPTSNMGLESDVNKVAEAAQPANNSWRAFCQSPSSEKEEIVEDHWRIYDKVWILLGNLNGKSKGDGSLSATLGQRARGLVESINIPAAEIAAAVVAGGLGAVVSINPSKLIDKAVKLRGEKFPRVAFHLVLLYVYRAGLESASHCIQHFVSLLPLFLEAESEQIKNRLQLFLWCLLEAREQVGSMDNGARFHLISQLIRETVDTGKNLLAASMIDKDDSSNDSASVQGVLQQDRVLNAVKEERNFLKSVVAQRNQEVESLNAELEEASSVEISQVKLLEDNLQQSLVSICTDENSRCAALQIANEENQQAISTQWCHLFRSLIDERGSWSRFPFPNDLQMSWKLDKTEDPWRRRFKLKRSYERIEPSRNSESSSKPGEDSSVVTEGGACPDTTDQVSRFLIRGLPNVTKEGVPALLEDAIEEHHTTLDEQLDGLEDIGVVLAGEEAAEEIVGGRNERVPSISAEREAAEEIAGGHNEQAPSTSVMGPNVILHSSVCVRVTGKRKLAGRLEIVGDCLHFYSEFAVEGTGGSSVFNSSGLLNYPEDKTLDVHERKSVGGFRADVEPKDGLGGPKSDNEKEVIYRRLDSDQFRAVHRRLKGIKRHWRWDVMKVKAVHGTRYLLQYTALEIFFSTSIPPVFFNFPSQKHAKEFGMKIVSARNELSKGKGSSKEKAGTVYFVDRKLSLELAERYRDQWRRHEINNFEYLMHLNTLAGRSYNDLTQYPVFPWVLSDYTSESLDLNSPTSFRDLSKPIGVLDAKRFEVFEERYHNFSDPEIPSFYYGSHYSSLGIVLFYLLRLEPFTSLHRNLQGGKFDHADRLFHSIEGAFKNCLANTSDVKELIPEFFYMPEFLVNTNRYYMGVKQDGEKLGDVVLPGWAKGSPEEFVSKNREALESEYVSRNLHQWIDLIFGYKQRGRPAVEAANVFYHLTYEGAVDLEALEDRLQRAAVEDQIANFGQTPVQLFRKKHPRRGPPRPIQRPLYYAPASITLTTSIPGSVLSPGTVSSEKDASLIFLGMVDTMVVIVTSDFKIIMRNWLTPSQAGGNFTFSSSQDPFFGIGAELSSPHKIRGLFTENIEFSSMLFHTLQVRSSSYLLTCGHWDNSFRVLALSDGSVLQSNRQHKDIVSCLSVSSDNTFLVTGSHDTTVMIWSIEALSSSKKMGQKDSSTSIDRSSKGEGVLFDKPRHVLCGHDDAVTCVAVSVELDLVVSGSKDCSCILHTLREGRYVRSIRNPLGTSISKIVVSKHGLMVIYSKDDLVFLLYSINGKHLASSESSGRVHCVEISNCGEFLVCGGDLGQVIVRSIYTLEIIRRYEGLSAPILSLTVTPEDCILAGTQDGSLLIYSVEMPQQKKVNILQSLRGRQS